MTLGPGVTSGHRRLLEVAVVDPGGLDLLAAHEAFVEAANRLVGDWVAVKVVAVPEHPRVPLRSELLGHLSLNASPAVKLRRIGSDVVNAVGVAGEVVELLG